MLKRRHTLTFWLAGLLLALCSSASLPAFSAPAAAKNTLNNVRFIDLPNEGLDVELIFAKPVKAGDIKGFVTKNPPRIVLDFKNTIEGLGKKAFAQINSGPGGNFSAVHAGNRTRVVVDLHQVANYKTHLHGNIVDLTIKPQPTGSKVSNQSFRTRHLARQHRIQNIDFRRTKQGGGQIIIQTQGHNQSVDLKQIGENLVADFVNTSISQRLQRKLDVVDFGTPVDFITTKGENSDVQMVISAHGEYTHVAYQLNNKFIIDIRPVKKQESGGGALKPHYTGERISLSFQDIPVRAVLQLLADFTGLNVVTSDSVGGNITLRLHNVPWDQALDIILRTRSLAKREVGNVMLIAPSQELANQERQELQAQNTIEELAPLQSDLIQINYANASDISTLLQSQGTSLLSTRGRISVDARTNTLWIQDTADKIREVRKLIRKLDVPVKQVLIEARVVKVDKSYEKNLGVRFGITKEKENVTGTLAGANDIASGTALTSIGTDSRLNFDVPVNNTSAATFGLALARLGRGFLLDLELSALESESHAEIISSPRVITADQQTASIESGEEIPFQQTAANGASVVAFRNAVLRLEVTPRITPDNRISLNLTVNQDARSDQVIAGVPAINTRQVQTQVLVNNGETIVLGGIYERTKQNQVNRIPFFGKLPFIGHLFRNTIKSDERDELLIFVTPKIIQTSIGNS